MRHGALILSIGGTLAAIVGSISVECSAYGSRVMLATNLIVITLSVIEKARRHERRQ